MNLGYLMVPQHNNAFNQAAQKDRGQLAYQHGFTEFYAPRYHYDVDRSGPCSESPETSSFLDILPKPPQHPTPHVITIDGERRIGKGSKAVSGATVPSETAEQIKSNVFNKHSSLSMSSLSNNDLARHWAAHVTASTHAGLRARHEDWRVARTIIVCDDQARAEATVKSDESPCRAYYKNLAKTGSSDAQIDALIDDCVLYGSLKSVLSSLRKITAVSGPFGTLTLVDHAWPDAQMAQHSIALLASGIFQNAQHNRIAI